MSGLFQQILKNGLMWVLVTFVLSAGASMAIAAPCGLAPTVSFDLDTGYAKAGDSVDYTVTIINNDLSACDLALGATDEKAGFTSTPDATPIVNVGSGTTVTAIVTVAVDGAALDWTESITTLTVGLATPITATTTVFDNNPLLHNSINLNSSKHGGNWGVDKPGNKYGEITCGTCHGKDTGNIKRVLGSITAPDGSTSFPGDGVAIDFQTVTDGSSDFGDDDPNGDLSPRTTSTRVCEVCHSVTNHHNFDTNDNLTAGQAHFNQKDCTACHAHNEGFKAGACSGCHGGGTEGTVGTNFWPDGSNGRPENDTPGRHKEHMDALASLIYGLADSDALLAAVGADTKQTDLCGYCHDTPGADGDHSATLPAETAFRPVWDKAAASSGTYTTLDGSCTNICHNSQPTGTGPGTWGWAFGGDDTSDCIMCHVDVTTDANTTGETHNDHVNAAAKFGRTIVCADCHDSTTSWATKTKPANNHLNGTLDAGGVVTLAYSGTTPPGSSYGSCNNNACHNDGTAVVGDPINNAYVWGTDYAGDCGLCHAALPTSNDHPSHINTEEDIYGSTANASWGLMDTNVAETNKYDFGCGNCHGDNLNNHLNGSRQVANTGWNGSTCSTAYCHSHKANDGVTVVNVTTPAWGAGFPAGDKCAKCHKNSPESAGHEEHQMGFHSEHVYSGNKDFLPVTNADPLPAYLVLGPADNGDADPMDDSRDPLRGHGGKLADGTITSTIFTCYVCHNSTVTERFNDQATRCVACHDGTNTIAPTMGDMDVANTNFHVNGTPDVVFVAENIRSKAQVRDDLADVPEIADNWSRIGGYKADDGSSYDEQPKTLDQMAIDHGGWDAPSKTCMISCHLWETGRVDKYPAHWINNSIHGSQPIMCIDCHTRLPK